MAPGIDDGYKPIDANSENDPTARTPVSPSRTMPLALTVAQARRLRLRAQHLDTRLDLDAACLVHQLGAVQAQDQVASQLALRVRTTDLTVAALEQALVTKRTVVRTWAMRGTLHLVPAADIHWMLRLLGPAMIRKAGRRHRELGLTEDVYTQAMAVMCRVLEAEGVLTRAQIAACWAQHNLPAEGQAVPHLLSRAAMEGVICFGPPAHGQATYALLKTWLRADGREVAEPMMELARRYLAAYAPATESDFQSWSGLPVAQTRQAFADLEAELLPVEVDGVSMWLPKDHADACMAPAAGAPAVRMLGAFDTYLLGYRTRDLDVPSALLKRVHPGGGIIRPVILVEGRAVATRSRRQTGDRIRITVAPFAALSASVQTAIIAETEDIGRFLGKEAICDIAPP